MTLQANSGISKYMKDTRRLKFVRLNSFPVGRILSSRSIIAKDPVTTAGIAQFQSHMQSESKGMLVFFAHLGLVDVFGTAAVLEKYFDYKGLFPVAASWFYFPILKKVFSAVAKQTRHTYSAVYRKEEMGTARDHIEMLDFSMTSDAEKRSANKSYVSLAKQFLQKSQHAVVLSPYGGRAPQFEYFRSGVTRLITKDVPVLYTLTKWSWKSMSYTFYFSELQYFDPEVDAKALHTQTYKEFFRMAQLAGVGEDELKNTKNPNSLSRKLWNIFAKVVKIFFPKLR